MLIFFFICTNIRVSSKQRQEWRCPMQFSFISPMVSLGAVHCLRARRHGSGSTERRLCTHKREEHFSLMMMAMTRYDDRYTLNLPHYMLDWDKGPEAWPSPGASFRPSIAMHARFALAGNRASGLLVQSADRLPPLRPRIHHGFRCPVRHHD